MIGRRQFLSRVLVLRGLNLAIGGFSLAALWTRRATDEYVVIKRFRSNLHPGKVYSSIHEFWADHMFSEGVQLNRFFAEKRYLLSKASYLEHNGQVMVQEKRFRSREAYEILEKMKSKITVNPLFSEIETSQNALQVPNDSQLSTT